MALECWTCGHEATASCAECYRLLAAKAHRLQMEVDRLRDQVERQARNIDGLLPKPGDADNDDT